MATISPSFGGFERVGGPQLARLESRVVDVSEKTVVPTIVRGGEEVKPPPLNLTKVEDLVGRLKPITRVSIPRAVSQSIPAGTRVPKGTPVDLVLVPVSDIDFSLFDKVHADFAAKTIDKILPVLSDPEVQPLLQKSRADDLKPEEKDKIKLKLAPLGIGVDDADPARSFSLAFDSLQNAKAFQ